MTGQNESVINQDFYKKNECDQNRVVLHMSYYTPLTGIAMIIGCLLGIFPFAIGPYIGMTVYLAVQSILMKIFCTQEIDRPWIKYYIVISTEVVCFFLTISEGFEPFIIYAVAPLLSCLYFNRRFSYIISTISYVAMIVSVAIRSQPGFLFDEGLSSAQWGLEYGIGLTLEYLLNCGLLYLMSTIHLDTLDANVTAIRQFQTTQDELIAGYSELIYEAHQTRKVNIKRCQSVVALLCGILQNHDGFPDLKNEEIVRAIISSVPLHDIGLIGVPDAIVSKDTTFTGVEKKEYQKHVVYGEELIRKNFYMSENREFLQIARLSALHHHEHWDGSGYPDSLVGFTIPVCARIIAVADELEMRICGDNEHAPVSLEVALLQIQKLAGSTLDPTVVEALLSCILSLEKIYCAPAAETVLV